MAGTQPSDSDDDPRPPLRSEERRPSESMSPAASGRGTSTTCSPSVSSRWASRRPAPLRPSTANTGSGNAATTCASRPGRARSSLPVMTARTDGAVHRSQEPEHRANDDQDDPDRPQDRDVEDRTENQQDDTQDNHVEPLRHLSKWSVLRVPMRTQCALCANPTQRALLRSGSNCVKPDPFRSQSAGRLSQWCSSEQGDVRFPGSMGWLPWSFAEHPVAMRTSAPAMLSATLLMLAACGRSPKAR